MSYQIGEGELEEIAICMDESEFCSYIGEGTGLTAI